MSFRKLDDSLLAVTSLQLPEHPPNGGRPYSYDILRHEKNESVFFYRQFEFDGREWLDTKSILRIGEESYRIEERTRTSPIGYQEKINSLTAIYEHKITRHRKSQLCQYLRELAPTLGKLTKNFRVSVIDAANPIKPRSKTQLIAALNKLPGLFSKPMLLSCQEIFLRHFTAEEIAIIKKHLSTSQGQGLTPIALLFFELGFEKRMNKTDAT